VILLFPPYRVEVEAHSTATSCSAVGLRRSIVLELIERVGVDAFGTY
jgi:hypothetical protein